LLAAFYSLLVIALAWRAIGGGHGGP